MPASTFSSLERFRVERPLTRGGMGDVYLANDARSGERVVLKVVREDAADGDGARLEHEIEVARALHAPLVPRYVADGRYHGRRAVVVALVDGVSLVDLGAGALDAAGAVALMVDVLGTLDEVHRATADDGAPRGLVHRDVTPHNILCDRRGRGWLIDFGISIDAAFDDPTPGASVGKLAWMAPEQAAGFALDARADQFSAGVVLWELLTGRSLFHAATDRATWRNVITCAAPHLSDVTLVDAGVGDVVARMLSPNRNARFASCGAAADALVDAAGVLGAPRPLAAGAFVHRAERPAPRTAVC